MRAISMILGCPVDDVTMPETVDRIYEMVDVGRATGRTHQVATVNVDFLVKSTADANLRRMLRRTDLSIPDGMPLVWGSRFLGHRLRERVAGADLLSALAERGAARSATIYLFGAAPGVAERAAEQLQAEHPGVRVIGDAGAIVSATGEMDGDGLQPIIDAAPDIVGVALGNPKQEHWIDRHRDRIGAPVFVGIGGTLDLLVGEKRRAPQWMQRSGLEWVFRAAQEPRRLAGRYAHDLVTFLPRLVRQIVSGRGGGDTAGSATLDGDVVELSGPPSLRQVRALDLAGVTGDRLVVDVAAVEPLGNRAAGVIASVALEARRLGLSPVLADGSPTQRDRIATLGLDGMFDPDPG